MTILFSKHARLRLNARKRRGIVLRGGQLAALLALIACTPKQLALKPGSNTGFAPSLATDPSAGVPGTNGSGTPTDPNVAGTPNTSNQLGAPIVNVPQELLGTILDPTHDFLQDPAAFQDVSARFPIFPNTGITVLENGPQYLAQRMRLLEQASRSVRLQSFIFTGDESGYLIADKLKELARRGIQVRVAVDDVANISFNSQMMYFDLKRNGIAVEGFESTFINAVNLFNGFDTFKNSFDKANLRFHDKSLVIDAEIPEKAVALMGGANIANEYFQVSKDYVKNWHDKDIVVRGPIAGAMAASIDANMGLMQNLKLNESGLSGNPVWAKFFALRPIFSAASLVYQRPTLDTELSNKALMHSRVAVPTLVENSIARFLQSRPRQGERHIHKAYIDLIRGAKTEILIENSYFVPTADFQAELVQASRRGVRVRILTNHPELSDLPTVQIAGRSLYKNIITDAAVSGPLGPVEIYEWAGQPVLNNGQGLDHAKFAIFDRKIAVVGSYNIDPRSQFLNSETVQIFANRTGIDQLVAEFEKDVSPTYAKRVTIQDAQIFREPQGFFDAIKLSFATAFQPLL